MKIIAPHTTKSLPVTRYVDIKNDAQAMKKLIDDGNFTGRWKEAFAISHCQVSSTPYDFFVLHRDMQQLFEGNRILANVKIVGKSDPMTFQEACMSFPFHGRKKLRRYAAVTIEADVFKESPFPFSPRMKHVTMEFEGLEAFIVQHEVDHAQGIDIYQHKSFT